MPQTFLLTFSLRAPSNLKLRCWLPISLYSLWNQCPRMEEETCRGWGGGGGGVLIGNFFFWGGGVMFWYPPPFCPNPPPPPPRPPPLVPIRSLQYKRSEMFIWSVTICFFKYDVYSCKLIFIRLFWIYLLPINLTLYLVNFISIITSMTFGCPRPRKKM